MFHKDCFQISSLNFRSSTETVSREDPQIDFATETFFCTCVAVHLDPKSKLLGKHDFLVLKKDEGKKHMLILSDHLGRLRFLH